MRAIDCNLWATAMVEHVHYSASVVLSECRCAAFEPSAVPIEVDEVHALFVETRPGHHLAQILMGGVGAAVGIHGYERIDDLLSRTTFDATRWEGRRWCVRREGVHHVRRKISTREQLGLDDGRAAIVE